MRKEIRAVVDDDTPYYLGQKLYVISSKATTFFREACTICNDTKKITIKGYQCDCPMCCSKNAEDNRNILRLYNPVILEYIINELKITGALEKGWYRNTDTHLYDVSYSAFHKTGKDMQSIKTRVFTLNDLNQRVPTPEEVKAFRFFECGNTFTEKIGADIFLDKIHSIQNDILMEFNREHNTHYRYPFKTAGE